MQRFLTAVLCAATTSSALQFQIFTSTDCSDGDLAASKTYSVRSSFQFLLRPCCLVPFFQKYSDFIFIHPRCFCTYHQQSNVCQCVQDPTKTDGSCDPSGGFQRVSCVENKNKDGTDVQSQVFTNSDCTGTSATESFPADTCRALLGSGLKIDCSAAPTYSAPTYSAAAAIVVAVLFALT